MTLLFLIKGHTKNICDRMFNLVKHEYHDLNIYSEDDLDAALGKHAQVSLFRLQENKFFDFESFFYGYYTEPDAVTKFHLFEYGFHPTATMMRAMTYAKAMGDEISWQNLQPSSRTKRKYKDLTIDERVVQLRLIEDELMQLTPPGLPPIKQFELWHKWRKIVPDEHKDITCPKPSDEVLKKYKEKKMKTRRQKQKKI